MTPEIEAVLASGATTLVTAVATDAWKAARAGFARVFGRGEAAREADTERRLDALATTVQQASPDGRAEILEGERARWLVRLTDLVGDDPSVLDDLRLLFEQVGAQLPAERKSLVQNNIARDSSQLFAVQDGNIVVHQDRPASQA